MKNFKKRVDAFLTRGRVVRASISGAMLAQVVSVQVYASEVDAAMGGILGQIVKTVRWAGAGLIVFGVYSLFMAILNERPEDRTKAFVTIVVGISIFFLKGVLNGFFQAANMPEAIITD